MKTGVENSPRRVRQKIQTQTKKQDPIYSTSLKIIAVYRYQHLTINLYSYLVRG